MLAAVYPAGLTLSAGGRGLGERGPAAQPARQPASLGHLLTFTAEAAALSISLQRHSLCCFFKKSVKCLSKP